MHHLLAARLPAEGALNRLDLATDAAHARLRLVYFREPYKSCHLISYPPILYERMITTLIAGKAKIYEQAAEPIPERPSDQTKPSRV